MKRVVTAIEMKEIDRLAQEKYGIPSIILMENAGQRSAEEILKDLPPHQCIGVGVKKGKAAIFCGKGNNGGDGFVCARYLSNAGLKVSVFLIEKKREIKNRDPLINLEILKKIGVDVKEVATEKCIKKLKKNFHYDFIVDAVFGIGFKGTLPGKISNIVEFLNNTRKRIYALDTPSGLNVSSGKANGLCIKAYKTITFGLPKKGFSSKKAKPYIGKLIVKDIGFPRQLLK